MEKQLKPDFDHWWENPSDKKKSARLTASRREKNAWQMVDSVAFMYELVRRLGPLKAEISAKQKKQVSKLPRFPDLPAEAKEIMCHALWTHWHVRPVAFEGSSFNTHKPFEHYCHPPLLLDLTSRFTALEAVLKDWYLAERKHRHLRTFSRQEALPFRVSWERVSHLEKHCDGKRSRPREGAIQLAKGNLRVVLGAWNTWERWKQPTHPEFVINPSHGVPLVPIWKDVDIYSGLSQIT